MGRLVHTSLGSSYLIAHVLHGPPPPPAHSFIIGPAVINTHTWAGEGILDFKSPDHEPMSLGERERERKRERERERERETERERQREREREKRGERERFIQSLLDYQ
jgi:hypothetical protein